MTPDSAAMKAAKEIRLLDFNKDCVGIASIATIIARHCRTAELKECLREVLKEAIVLSRDYLSAFEQWPNDATIQGWDKARWLRALAASDKAERLLAEMEKQ